MTNGARNGVTSMTATGIRAIRTSGSGDSRTGAGIDRVPATTGRLQETNPSRAVPGWLDGVRTGMGERASRKTKTKDINNDMQTILSHLLILKTAGSCR
ncbi:hypothetical protein DP56_5585 [Burkholderia pseudomallei]|nr:hypothetical protein DP56_5585 [Burkholderia pseudomallei]